MLPGRNSNMLDPLWQELFTSIPGSEKWDLWPERRVEGSLQVDVQRSLEVRWDDGDDEVSVDLGIAADLWEIKQPSLYNIMRRWTKKRWPQSERINCTCSDMHVCFKSEASCGVFEVSWTSSIFSPAGSLPPQTWLAMSPLHSAELLGQIC